ncbi:MAG: L-threonylcarbamoyladenylate synthase [Parachlamydiaceae bacterium]
MKVDICQAALLLSEGKVVAIPTETVYGLAASLHSPQAVHTIFDLKKRPPKNPLIVHLYSKKAIFDYIADVPPHLEDLVNAFWPGPLTLITNTIAGKIPEQVSAGLPTAAFRFPQHPFAQAILRLAGPLVIPSANLSGRPSSTAYEHVEEDFGEDFPVVDGGRCSKGLESTILIFKEDLWQIARLGALSREELTQVLPYAPPYAIYQATAAPLCPGQMYKHYAPKAKLVLTNCFNDASLIIGFEDRDYPPGVEVWHWGSSDDPQKVAQSLYHLLRKLDQQNKAIAWIDSQFPQEGLWQTIHERIQKAAAK